MSETAPEPTRILDGLRSRASDNLPAWLNDQRASAWTQFQSLPMPVRTDQAWRFSNIAALDLSPYTTGRPLSAADARDVVTRSVGIEKTSGRLVFADDHFLQRDVLSEKLRKAGVIFQPLERAMVEHEDLFRKHFMSQPATLGSAKFAALHEAFVRVRNFSLSAARCGSGIAARDVSLAACRKSGNFPAHPRRGR